MIRSPKKAEKLEIRLPVDTKEAFLQRCRTEERSASEAVRAFIETHLGAAPPAVEVAPAKLAPGLRAAALAGGAALALALAGVGMSLEALRDLPDAAQVARLANLSSGGVTVRALPSHVYQAVLSAQDAGFFAHAGYDGTAIRRALVNDLAPSQWGRLQGGSTLTQQLAKNVLLRKEPKSLRRKFREIVLARQIERRLGKEEILDAWLNTTYFGAGAVGISQAANTYFGKPAQVLTVAEAAYLAAAPNAPERLRIDRPQNRTQARQSRDQVLENMVKHGYLAPSVARSAQIS